MDYQKDDLDKAGAPAAKVHKIRITLTSKNVKPLEKCESTAALLRTGVSGGLVWHSFALPRL